MLLYADKLFSKEWFKSLYLIIQGAIIAAFGYNFFLIPHKIIPGGLMGLSSVFYHLLGIPVGMLTIILNIPLILLGMRILGNRFGYKTILGMTLLSLFNDGMNFFWHDVKLTDDIFLSGIIGGTLVGAGVASIFKAKATTGGTDIIAQLFHVKFKFSTGKVVLFTNIIFLSLGAFSIHMKNPETTEFFKMIVYAIITQYTTSKVMDVILEGTSYYKGIFIISNRYDEVKEKLLTQIRRGGTMIHGQGMFKDDERKIIFTAVSRRESAFLKEYIKSIDPQAFIIIFQTNEIYGQGFLPVKDIE
jgi:uncharacterized membrane-anchored protein YitT (DUF2179 family)